MNAKLFVHIHLSVGRFVPISLPLFLSSSSPLSLSYAPAFSDRKHAPWAEEEYEEPENDEEDDLVEEIHILFSISF